MCLSDRKYLEPVPAAGSIQAMTVLVQPATYLELKPSKKHKYCIFAKLVGTLVANNCLFSWVVGWRYRGKDAGPWRITWFPEDFPERSAG